MQTKNLCLTEKNVVTNPVQNSGKLEHCMRLQLTENVATTVELVEISCFQDSIATKTIEKVLERNQKPRCERLETSRSVFTEIRNLHYMEMNFSIENCWN